MVHGQKVYGCAGVDLKCYGSIANQHFALQIIIFSIGLVFTDSIYPTDFRIGLLLNVKLVCETLCASLLNVNLVILTDDTFWQSDFFWSTMHTLYPMPDIFL